MAIRSKLIHEFQRRDEQIRRAGDFDEVVLWFEHDLFDQLQVLQVLTSLEELDLEPGASRWFRATTIWRA